MKMDNKHEEEVEQKIKELGLNAPRVTKEHIENLMAQVEYSIMQVSPTRVHCAASLDGFSVGDGFSGCIDPKNFNFELGKQISKRNAENNARNNLWQFEGWRLFTQLNNVICCQE